MDTTEHDNSAIDASRGDGAKPDLVRVSKLALIACFVAIVTLPLLPGMFRLPPGSASIHLREVFQSVVWVVTLSAVALGLTSLIRIGLSKGRLVGVGFAWIGVALPTLKFLFLLTVPLLARTRCVAFTNTCGTNLSGIGKAMLIYANDYEDMLPRAGGRNTVWGPTPDWKTRSRVAAFGLDPSNNSGGKASISSCFYLLVKYAEVTPKSFLCKGDPGITEFKLTDLPRGAVPSGFELIDGWDFGPPSESVKHYSYSYHYPFSQYALTVSNDPGVPVAADRNPWMDSPSMKAGDFARFKADIPPFDGTEEQARAGSTSCHHGDGQNVMFLDTHVDFEKRAFCGLDDDNIYTVSKNPTGGDPLGVPPKLDSCPSNRRDSVLVNDPVDWSEQKEDGNGRANR